MRVLVCGGRDYNDRDRVFSVLDAVGATTVIQGGASGADKLAAQWANANANLETYAADWKRYGKAAGPIRNHQMIDEGTPDLVIAFPGGRGTANMIGLAIDARIPVRIIKDDRP